MDVEAIVFAKFRDTDRDGERKRLRQTQQLLGFDFVGSPGYGGAQMVGLVFIVLGCGVGKWLARTLAQSFTRGRP